VVIAIISVLASVVIVNVSSYIQKGKDARLRADFAEIAKAARLDYIRCGDWALDTGPGELPRFADPRNTEDCTNGQVLYSGDFKADYYCENCVFDWDNWTPYREDLAIGTTFFKDGKILHGHPIIMDGFKEGDIYYAHRGSGDYW